jgi:hypothetical protein
MEDVMTYETSQTAPDRAFEQRPGVPRQRNAEPMGNAHWERAARQSGGDRVLRDAQRTEPTATFGTEHPPRGLSGVLRRSAYQVPDYRARRWLMLIIADRIDTIESRVSAAAKRPSSWIVAGLLGAGAWLAFRRH